MFMELQRAFFDMLTEIENYGEGWVITVFDNGDPRVHGAAWVADMKPPPVMYMSDDLYSLYCAEVGIKNENMRR